MAERATVLVNVSALERTLGAASPQGDIMVWNCGCAVRYDRGELAWRYAARCTEHDS